MYYAYSKSVRAFRLNRTLQFVLEIAFAVSSALLVSYLILHLPI